MIFKETWRFISGAAIVTGTTVGAGMLAIPTQTAGLWYTSSLLVLLVTWAVMMLSGLLILEASQGFDTRDNFPTVVKKRLGKGWAALNSLSLAFVLYILVYAYITAGGSLTSSNLNAITGTQSPLIVGQIIFFVVLGLIVWLSYHWVARFNALIIGGLFLTFFMAIGGMLPEVQADNLFPAMNGGEWKYLLPTLPVVLTSFGYHINVPTLRVYFQDQNKKIAWAIAVGTFTALILYVLWQTAIQGNLPRSEFAPVIASGGEISVLIHSINSNASSALIAKLLGLFSYFAIATSFLGVALGLLEFIADFFKIENTVSGRLKVAAISLLPPALLAFWKPEGFLLAIGYAGLALTIWSLIIPAMMVYKLRQEGKGAFRVWGGKSLLIFILLFAVINIAAQLLEAAKLTPAFTG